MKKILVTGGAGFIGSNLIKHLIADAQNQVICLDNFDTFYAIEQKKKNIQPFFQYPNFRFEEGDIRHPEDLERIGPVSVIVHLAAKAGVRPSIENPAAYLDVNVNGTQHLLDFAIRNNVKQFVFASSSSVYGTNPNVPWKETEELLPISPYASTKLMGEMMGENYVRQYGIRFIALRFFTVYGAAQRPDLAIHQFFKAIIEGKPISMFGNGTSLRDYTYVEDTVKGILAAIDYDQSDFEIINLGNNQAIALSELVKAIEHCLGKKARLNTLPEQPGDVPQTYADISKAQSLLAYSPATPLKDGLTAFYEWFKANYLILQ